MRILIVEDDLAFREALALYLAFAGHTVIEAPDCRSALESLDADLDLLLTDLRLPDGTGLDILEQARSKHPRQNVLLMTAFGTIMTEEEASARGARGFLSKPIDEARLERCLAEIELETEAKQRDSVMRA